MLETTNTLQGETDGIDMHTKVWIHGRVLDILGQITTIWQHPNLDSSSFNFGGFSTLSFVQMHIQSTPGSNHMGPWIAATRAWCRPQGSLQWCSLSPAKSRVVWSYLDGPPPPQHVVGRFGLIRTEATDEVKSPHFCPKRNPKDYISWCQCFALWPATVLSSDLGLQEATDNTVSQDRVPAGKLWLASAIQKRQGEMQHDHP